MLGPATRSPYNNALYQSIHLVDAVIDYAPADGLFHEDHAFSRGRFAFESCLEKDALVISLRNTDELMNVGRANERAQERVTERRAPGLHVTHKLFLRA